MNENILQVKNLNTLLQVGPAFFKVVDGLSFTLQKGKTLAIVGESGSGKTMAALSLLRILPSAALLPKGEVWFRGENLMQISESKLRKIRGRGIAMIFQDPASALNPVYKIGEQIQEAVDLHLQLDVDEARKKSLEILAEAGVPSPEERFDEYPHQLSGGLKQRVMIAMALVCQPDILIADEPTTALDVTIQAQVLELIRSLQAKRGMSLLLITHDMGVVAEMADDVVVMYASQAVECGSVYDVFYFKAHPYTRALFASRPQAKSQQARLHAIPGFVPSLDRYPAGCRFHPRCPYVMEKCKSGDIPFFAVPGSGEHQTRCLLYDETTESREKLLQIGGQNASSTA